jgi:malonate transporter
MNPIVLSSLLPVVLLIAIGLIAGRAGFMRTEATKDLSSLVFTVLTPALLFRTMSTVHVERLDFKPVAVYFAGAMLMGAAMLVWRGVNRRSVVLALAAMFSNTVAIGIPLIGLAYGKEGLVTLFTLISLHSLILLTLATVLLEVSVAQEDARAARSALSGAESCAQGGVQPVPQRHMAMMVLAAVRNGLIHPVPLPIIVGLLFAQTGWVMPEVMDRPLMLLANAMGPLALVLVGVTLAGARIGAQLQGALGLTFLKNLGLPALVAALGLLLGLNGLPLTVMIVTASLPTGANVFMFSQRYNVAEELVTAEVAVSTGLSVLTISLVMAAVGWL